MIAIRPAAFPVDTTVVREIFREYVHSLGIDLAFQDVDGELAALPGKYAAPSGTVLLAFSGDDLLGCGAVRASGKDCAEMKRLYVRPAGRGHAIGRCLALALCAAARDAGYARIRLDTLGSMAAAQSLYASLGFVEIEAYVHNPVPGTRFMELDLATLKTDGRSGWS
jgi:GNAT superfamily N-acetyltransferase